jgi:hypothetical protein
VDDEQGPWWTRPPEPGPQAPVVSRPQSEPDSEADDEPDDGIVTPPAPQPWVPQQPGGQVGGQPGEPSTDPEPFGSWGTGFATPSASNPWEAHQGLFTEPAPDAAAGAEPAARTAPTPLVAPERRSDPSPGAPPEPWTGLTPGPTPAPGMAPEARFEPEPEPPAEVPPSPPRKPQQVVRRVAVVNPDPPPSSNDRTETLPALGDDIFAVFDAQGRQGHQAAPPAPTAFDPYGGNPEDPLSHLRDDPDPNRLHLPRVQMPEPRFLLMAVGSGLVVLLVLLVVLLFDGGGGDDPTTATPTPVTSSGTVAAALTGAPPSGLKKLSDGEATAMLAKAGQGANGQINEAWTWTDKNGRNLVVTTTEVTGRNRQTLRVIHLADVDGDVRKLRVMRDPDLPDCRNKAAVGAAGFTKNAMMVRDLDGDGVAEVTAGWTSRCGARTGLSEIKLALITDGQKYIIRDRGVVGQAGAGSPDPKTSTWPDGFYPALSKLYRKLYG